MNTSRRFQKKKEDFECENCGELVIGNGYTNHCPKCLYSKHVDKNPGDRESKCLGIMRADSSIQKNGEYSIIHVCQKCNLQKINKVSREDNFDEIIKLSKIH